MDLFCKVGDLFLKFLELFSDLWPKEMEISMLEFDWLAYHQPFIKLLRTRHHPVPKSYGHLKAMNKLTLNKPATINKNTCGLFQSKSYQ